MSVMTQFWPTWRGKIEMKNGAAVYPSIFRNSAKRFGNFVDLLIEPYQAVAKSRRGFSGWRSLESEDGKRG
jgi:hypothetical protein